MKRIGEIRRANRPTPDRATNMKQRYGWYLALIVAASLGAAACSKGEAEAPGAPGGRGGGAAAGGGRAGRGAGPAVPVTVATAIKKDVPREIMAIGTAEASMIVQIRAQVTGVLTKVNFKEGDDVTKGQVLFELDRRPLEAAVNQAVANLDRDAAQYATAKTTSQRVQELFERGIATRDQADQARTSAAALEATVQADKAALDNAKVQLAYATIPAEIAGRTGQLQVHQGNLVRANDANALVQINAVSPINVTFGIPEAQLPDLKRYMAQGAVRVEATPPSETVPSTGTITFVDNSVDQTTGQIKVKGSFPNTDRRLWPGLFVNVTVKLSTDPNATVVPRVAVQTGPNGSYVYIVKQDRTVDMRPIAIARTSGDDALIKDGVSAGETVVTDGQLRLVQGTRVDVKTGGGAEAAEGGGGEGGGRRGGEGAGRSAGEGRSGRGQG
jgi:multidrug efflux system membrane fusion protein